MTKECYLERYKRTVENYLLTSDIQGLLHRRGLVDEQEWVLEHVFGMSRKEIRGEHDNVYWKLRREKKI